MSQAKSIDAIFPTGFAYFVSLITIIMFVNGALWSAIFDITTTTCWRLKWLPFF